MAAEPERVMGVVVTYHPDAGLAARLAALAPQVDALVVVDNGSPDLAAVKAAAAACGARLIANDANLGVAAALNQAARLALADGFGWLAMFDHDSLVPPGAIAGLLAVHAAHPQRERIAVLAMSHRDRASGRDYHRRGDILLDAGAWRSVRSAITSGAMVPRATLEDIGLFDEALFIDGVDHDYCLRCRAAGQLVIESRDVTLDHALGEISHRRLFGRDVPLSNHSAERRYYITRNTLELAARHAGTDPAWAAREAVHLAASNLAVALLERNRGAKLAAMVQGGWHFARRRFGPRLPAPRRVGSGEGA